ncbi:MAG: hypothetical protein OIF57_06755 [Marinobacterium sp.]|nr:hypothetical protein [Marinobacterium sp.]
MTPNELLLDVRDRFVLLMEHDEERLIRMLRTSLGAYQDKAGHIITVISEAPEMDIPVTSAGFVGVNDCAGLLTDMQPGSRIETNEEGEEVAVRTWQFSGTGPFEARYFLDFRKMDLDSELPPGSISLIGDHLYVSLEKLNTQRQRLVNTSSNLPADHFRSDAELDQLRVDVEARMQEEGEIIPFTVTC